ncbi:unnamed protein product, partial [Chrysoparadoxa australica]
GSLALGTLSAPPLSKQRVPFRSSPRCRHYTLLMDMDTGEEGGKGAFLPEGDIEAEYDVGTEPVEDEGMDMEAGDEEELVDAADATFTGHSDSVYCVAINPQDPTQILSGGGDDKAFLWSLRSNGDIGNVHELVGHSDSVSSVGFSADGTLCATGGYDGKVLLWGTADGLLKHTLEGPEDIEWLDWHPKGQVLAAGSKDGTVWMWLGGTGACMQVFAGHLGRVGCGGFNVAGRALVTASDDNTVRVWAPKTGECRHIFQVGRDGSLGAWDALGLPGHDGHHGPVTCLAMHHSPEQSYLVLTGSDDGTAKLLNLQTHKVTHRQTEQNRQTLLSKQCVDSPSSCLIPSLLDVVGHLLARSVQVVFSVVSVGFSTTQPWCATSGLDCSLKIWDLNATALRQDCVHPAAVTKLQWHSSRPVVFTCCADALVRAWDAREGICLREFQGGVLPLT